MYRQLTKSAVWRNSDTLKVWIWCLFKAKYEPQSWDNGRKEFKIDRGQFVTGRFSAADDLNMSESSVWRHLKKLQEWGNIVIESNNRFSLITVVNYEHYQGNDLDGGQQTDGKRTTIGQQPDTVKEYKNTRRKEVVPQTASEVGEYMNSLNPTIDVKTESEKFFDHFSSNGWRVGGKAPMKDWRAAVRNWLRNKGKNNGTTFGRTAKSSQHARAEFKHGPEELKRLEELKATLDERDRKRGQRSGTD